MPLSTAPAQKSGPNRASVASLLLVTTVLSFVGDGFRSVMAQRPEAKPTPVEDAIENEEIEHTIESVDALVRPFVESGAIQALWAHPKEIDHRKPPVIFLANTHEDIISIDSNDDYEEEFLLGERSDFTILYYLTRRGYTVRTEGRVSTERIKPLEYEGIASIMGIPPNKRSSDATVRHRTRQQFIESIVYNSALFREAYSKGSSIPTLLATAIPNARVLGAEDPEREFEIDLFFSQFRLQTAKLVRNSPVVSIDGTDRVFLDARYGYFYDPNTNNPICTPRDYYQLLKDQVRIGDRFNAEQQRRDQFLHSLIDTENPRTVYVFGANHTRGVVDSARSQGRSVLVLYSLDVPPDSFRERAVIDSRENNDEFRRLYYSLEQAAIEMESGILQSDNLSSPATRHLQMRAGQYRAFQEEVEAEYPFVLESTEPANNSAQPVTDVPNDLPKD